MRKLNEVEWFSNMIFRSENKRKAARYVGGFYFISIILIPGCGGELWEYPKIAESSGTEKAFLIWQV